MPRISLAGFKDPVRRPRYIIWTGVVLVVLIPLVVVMLGVTSSRWFCAQACHKVQDDLINAYEHGVHSEIQCLACHEPVNADPVTFMLLKTKALKELYETITDTWHFPLNAGSALALNEEEMGERQCIQCHSKNRRVTPSPGIRIDHEAHAKNDVWCTVCHNRAAHPEDEIQITLKTKSGEPNVKHASFMKMTACFRCHDLEGKKKAPGACPTCHTPGFTLKPASHSAAGFYTLYGDSHLHAELAKEASDTVAEEKKEAEKLQEEGIPADLAEPVFYCSTCHIKSQFCDVCHGLDMPHPSNWVEGHGAIGKEKPAVCANCHARGAANAVGTAFCNNCHHPQGDPAVPWVRQHFNIVKAEGATGCLKTGTGCHDVTFCAYCHVNGRKPE